MANLTDTITLTETIIDLSDQHTALAHLGVPRQTAIGDSHGRSASAAAALPLSSRAEFCELHKAIFVAGKRCADLRGSTCVVLDRLRPGYSDNKFWHLVMDAVRSDVHFEWYPDQAWNRLLPVDATPASRIDFVGRDEWSLRIRPRPRVLIYPFGWSTWLSLRLLGAHSIAQLADIVEYVFTERCLQAEGSGNVLSVRRYFDWLADGVRADAFQGLSTDDIGGRGFVAVTTVLAKTGPSPALGALSAEDERIMLRLVRPETRPSRHPFEHYVRRLGQQSTLDYVLLEDRVHFLWVNRLLAPEGRNHAHLRCYHNNTYHSVARAGHLQALLDEAGRRPPSPALDDLVAAACDELTHLRYKNPALMNYVGSPAFVESVRAAQQRSTR